MFAASRHSHAPKIASQLWPSAGSRLRLGPPRFAGIAAVALAAALLLAPTSADAGGNWTPPAGDAQAADLLKVGREKKSNFVEGGVSWGRASILIDAPLKDVKAAILDYGNYSQFITRFQKSKVLKREGASADVYLQLPILKGAATMWTVEHFNAPVAEGKGEKIIGTMMKGNVEDMKANWHYRAVDATHTIATLEIYAVPKLAVPPKLMLSQLEDACGEGVIGVREKAEAAAKLVAAKKP